MTMILGIFLALLTIMGWGAYSLVSVLYPLRPFRSRKKAALSVGLSLVGLVAFTLTIAPLSRDMANDMDKSRQEAASKDADGSDGQLSGGAISGTVTAASDIPDPCGTGGLRLGDVVAVNGTADLHSAADAASPKIVNEKASAAAGKTTYHLIDYSTTVRRLCVQSDWTEIQIVTPEWLADVSGWVPNATLREMERTETGARVYVEADFYWDEDTSAYKPEIIAVVNRIARENENCAEIDPSSVARSVSKGSAADPVFFVTCGSGMEVFNVWFRPGDAKGTASFAAKVPLDRANATAACEMAAKRAATHPSKVDFSRLWDLAYIPYPSGRARVVSSFSAENGFGLELAYRIDCLFDGATLIETTISERLD